MADHHFRVFVINHYVGGGNMPRLALKAKISVHSICGRGSQLAEINLSQMIPSNRTQTQGRRKGNKANCKVAYAKHVYVSLITFDAIFF